jgi:hypothetical protein
LTLLGFDATRVTDAGLDHVASLTCLESLSFVGTKITGTGIEKLKRLKVLQDLRLGRNQASAAAIADLRQALPELEVERWPLAR